MVVIVVNHTEPSPNPVIDHQLTAVFTFEFDSVQPCIPRTQQDIGVRLLSSRCRPGRQHFRGRAYPTVTEDLSSGREDAAAGRASTTNGIEFASEYPICQAEQG